jgi:hypothetical protein
MTAVSDQDSLARWYRRLLHAYPRRYRRLRATEMLTTLLDAAEPGQRRPHPRDALDLLLRGVRCRFAIPRGPAHLMLAYLMVAALLSAFAGLGAAAAVGWATWRTAAPAPDLASARAVAAVAVPLRESGAPSRFDDPLALDYELETAPRKLRLGSARVGFSYPAPADRAMPDLVAEAHARLAADGWRVQAPDWADPESEFWASKGGHIVHVRGYSGLPNIDDTLDVVVHSQAARWFTPVVGAALSVGLAAGWLLAAWALHRFRQHGVRSRLTSVLFGAPGLFTTGAILLVGAYQAMVAGLEGGWAPNDSLFAASAFAVAALPAGIATAALLLAGAALALPIRPHQPQVLPPEQAWRYRFWAMTGTHLTFASVWCAVAVVFVAWGPDLGEVVDPKELIPFGTNPINPFMWLYAVVSLLYLFGFMISPLLLTVSVPMLVMGRPVARQAGLQTAWRLLLVAAATAVLLPIVYLTPFGLDTLNWWLD